jgi:decaprenylphospho-beta-D-erythro-pentofuranosid-2-ulose 2-reductase
VFLAALRNRVSSRRVHVLTLKPGFVDTAMTADVPKNALIAAPDRVAKDILRAVERRKDEIYTPGFWRVVMAVLRAIPDWIFKRLSMRTPRAGDLTTRIRRSTRVR